MDERVTDDKIIIVQTQGRPKPLWGTLIPPPDENVPKI